MKVRRPKVIFATGLMLLLLGAVIWWRNKALKRPGPVIPSQEHTRIASNVLHTVSAETVSEVLRIEAEERQAEEQFWGPELVAQRHGAAVEKLWDAVNAATNAAERWKVIQDFAIDEIVLGEWKNIQAVSDGIEIVRAGGATRTLNTNEWRNYLLHAQNGGWEVEQVEFRHNRFELGEPGQAGRSRFYFSAHVKNGAQRAQIEGDLAVEWAQTGPESEHRIKQVDATALTVKRRNGEPVFKLVLDNEIVPQGQSRLLDPLILYDLDGDGLSEIGLAGRNLVYRNRGTGGEFRFEPETLCKHPEEFISTGLIADFDGDDLADFLAHKWEGTFLFKGSKQGRFEEKPRRAWKPLNPLSNPMVMTCGDIDADGDLDVFIAQYKEPYDGGRTPQPFHDANDGFPAYLLLNDGAGGFRDATEGSGLVAKRNRRTYSASFADLDADADLDLLVVSDFAGLDLYRNDGKGHFSDVTHEWISNTKAFGMAHALSDFNNDARIDLFVIGMTSPAIERLTHPGLSRNESAQEQAMRREMTYGNRLYFGTAAGGFEENALSATIARSGWSWGCSGVDFNNDGWVDVYVANGLESNASVKDYEAEYWLHDRFVGATNASEATELYFKAKFARTRARTDSYGGYEKNRFFINLQGKEFFEAGYLLGMALPEDCRNVVCDDFDGDGRVDLAVMTLEIWPTRKQSLKVFRNVGSASARAGAPAGTGEAPVLPMPVVPEPQWIGFHFEGDGKGWVGAEVRLKTSERETVRMLVTGDSYRSQHAPAVHFGLGPDEVIEQVEVRRIGGSTEVIRSPKRNQYHRLSGASGQK